MKICFIKWINGASYKGGWKNGKKDGLFTWWYKNGKKEYEGTYSEGKKLSVEEWNEDGSAKE